METLRKVKDKIVEEVKLTGSICVIVLKAFADVYQHRKRRK